MIDSTSESVSSLHDVFLCHNARDQPSVEQLAHGLLALGIRPWFDKWDLRPGMVWMDALSAAIREVPFMVVCVGPHGTGPWQAPEFRLAFECAIRDKNRVIIPVWLPEAGDTPLPPFLADRHAVDLRGSRWREGLAALASVMRGNASPGATVEIETTAECPYRGLEAFHAEHARWMFGRADDVQRLLEHLRGFQRFLMLVGASGCGKSSLVHAGLVPAIRTGQFDDSYRWACCAIRPGRDPLRELALGVFGLRPGSPHGISRLAEVRSGLAKSADALEDAIDLVLGPDDRETRVVLVVDQFEELFGEARGSGQTNVTSEDGVAFVTALVRASTRPGGRVFVVATLRSDFLTQCLALMPLAERINELVSFAVPPLGERQLRDAIVKPAEHEGVTVEEALIEELVSSVRSEPGRLPILQFVLTELWTNRANPRAAISLQCYHDLGGIEAALTRRAEDLIKNLDPHELRAAREVLLRLVHLGQDAPDTRRRAVVSQELGETHRKTLDRLAKSRLVTVDGDAAELAHEVLLRAWPTLHRWVDENREALRLRQDVSAASREWSKHGRRPDDLLRGARFQRLVELRASGDLPLSPLEDAFLAASQTAARRAQRIQIAAIATLGVLAVALAVVAAIARDSRHSAEAARRVAVRTSDEAVRSAREANARLIESLIAQGSAHFAERHWQEAAAAFANVIQRVGPDGNRLAELGLIAVRTASPTPVLALQNGNAFPGGGRILFLDDRHVLVGAYGRVDLIEVPAGRVLRSFDVPETTPGVEFLPDHRGLTNLSDVVLSPDRKTLAVGDENVPGVFLWNVAACAFLRVLALDAGARIDFSPDGRFVAAVSTHGGPVRVWSVEGVLLREIPLVRHPAQDGVDSGRNATARDLVFWDANSLIVGLDDGRLHVVSLDRGAPTQAGPLVCAEFQEIVRAGNAPLLAVGCRERTVSVLAMPTLEVVTRMEGDPVGETFVATFSQDARRLVTGGRSGNARVWDVRSGSLIHELPGHQKWVNGVAFSPGGELIATTGSENEIFFWPSDDRAVVRRLSAAGDGLASGRLSADGTRLTVVASDHRAMVLDVETGLVLDTLVTPMIPVDDRRPEDQRFFERSGTLTNVSLSRDARRLVASVADREIGRGFQTWVLGTGVPAHIEACDHGCAVALAADGSRVAVTGTPGFLGLRVLAWPGDSETCRATVLQRRDDIPAADEQIAELTFSADGRFVFGGDGDGVLRQYDASTCALVRTMVRSPEPSRSSNASVDALATNGEFVAAVGRDIAAIAVWSVDGRQMSLIRSGVPEHISGLWLSPHSSFLGATASEATIWDIHGARSVFRVPGWTTDILFTQDERSIVVVGDRGVYVVDMTWTEDFSRFEDAAPRRVTSGVSAPFREPTRVAQWLAIRGVCGWALDIVDGLPRDVVARVERDSRYLARCYLERQRLTDARRALESRRGAERDLAAGISMLLRDAGR